MSGPPASSARQLASSLVASLAEREPQLVEAGGIDIGPALEQQLFFVARDQVQDGGDEGPPLRDSVAGIARLVGASFGSLLGTAPPPRAEVVVLLREPTHYPVLMRLGAELERLGGPQPVLLRVGRAARVAPQAIERRRFSAPRLATQLAPSSVPAVAAFQARVAARLVGATEHWPIRMRQVAARELPRIALGAIALRDAAGRRQARLLVAFDEVGTWARIVPAVAHALGISSLDLPHAEAADPDAIRGAGYDRMAVYGEAAARVLREAGIPSERIVAIGAPRFDPLLDGSAYAAVPDEDADAVRRVVYAEQYVTGAMTAEALAECRAAARAAVAAAAPAELVSVPHPVAGTDGQELHHALPGAWAMVTGWSNSVLEAAIAGVPSIAVNPGGLAPVDYAAEGLALGASDAETAAAAARLLLDPDERAAAIARARAALPERIGPLDGGATERAARLVLRMIDADVGGPL